ncbi:MAG: bifunctional phosphopantothenoylcysteine decarboxylase/phosphopantothenate--cysteine ligase CoaBC, partial [Sulfurimonadaceae bacterium]|nr:bifunctional phosphopantothenoylcysteine decarboxylase/phosphopantothenate--cysteine ligase CoaBC [Sulfurimonadaceae bacterium]
MIIPENLLEGKKVLLGVSGSIAVYKSLELTRLFVKAGADVKVIMTDAAKKFVTPLSFETLSRNKVLDESSESWSDDHNHIQSGQWADLFVIAPCTANTIAKLANGIADNMLTQAALAYPDLKLIAPSANTNMLFNPITQASLQALKSANYELVGTQTKELACQTTGDGAMAEPLEIFWQASRILLKEEFWEERSAIVSGGGTVEKIDDVRYLSNYSSGKMASALATALFLKGADVNLIATRRENDLPQLLQTIDVESSSEMFECLNSSINRAKEKRLSKHPYLFMAAAVSDYVPADAQEGKLKKDMIGKTWALELEENIDILKNLDKEEINTVAFKAEMDSETAIKNAS